MLCGSEQSNEIASGKNLDSHCREWWRQPWEDAHIALVALGNSKFPPAFVWVWDFFFPLNLFLAEFEINSMKLSKLGSDLISSRLTDALMGKHGSMA